MWQALIPLFSDILNRVLPDKAQADAAKLKLLELTQAGVLADLDAQVKLAVGQMETNKVEAANASLFVSGWRPGMGWCCVAIFAANYIVGPLLSWASPVLNVPPMPMLDLGEVTPVLLGMLGLGALRTKEKLDGVAAK